MTEYGYTHLDEARWVYPFSFFYTVYEPAISKRERYAQYDDEQPHQIPLHRQAEIGDIAEDKQVYEEYLKRAAAHQLKQPREPAERLHLFAQREYAAQ